MADLKLTFACGLYDRVLPLYRGDVKPAGIDLEFLAIDDPRQVFDRMGKGEFDVSEMSSSEFVAATAAGTSKLVAIPVFVSRLFRHGFVFVNGKSGIRTPKDLEGKRIGVSAYTQTAAVWIRGFLQHDHGVDFSKVRWLQGPMNGGGGHPRLPKLARPVDIALNETGKPLSELLASGELDAVLGALVPDSFGAHPDVVRLFPDFHATEKDYYRRTRIFPIMHLIAIKRAVHEKHPEIAQSLFDAFAESKAQAIERMREVGALAYMTPWLADHIREMDEVFGPDAWPYGIGPNRPTLEALLSYMAEQGVIAAAPKLDALFVPVTE